MLQIHSYAQLAHWAVVTLTTVEDRCEKDQTPHGGSLMCLFKPRLFQKRKENLNKTTQSMSRLSPEYIRLISSSLYSDQISGISSRFLFRRFLFLYFSTTHRNSGRLPVSLNFCDYSMLHCGLRCSALTLIITV